MLVDSIDATAALGGRYFSASFRPNGRSEIQITPGCVILGRFISLFDVVRQIQTREFQLLGLMTLTATGDVRVLVGMNAVNGGVHCDLIESRARRTDHKEFAR